MNIHVALYLKFTFTLQQWDNVTILNYRNWVTKNSIDSVIISGTKFANNNIILTNATYENLPIPKYARLISLRKIYIQWVSQRFKAPCTYAIIT